MQKSSSPSTTKGLSNPPELVGSGVGPGGVVGSFDSPPATPTGIYADHAPDYFEAGHRPLPLGEVSKGPPPTGFTGWNAVVPSRADIEAWRHDRPNDNIGLHLPPGVLGIDIDDYGDKHGAETMKALIADYGPLPNTFTSTSRGRLSKSRIAFYRVPDGLRFRGGFKDIELIHTGHRYVVVWPSIHPDTRQPYSWYDPRGRPFQSVPSFDDLPSLPS